MKRVILFLALVALPVFAADVGVSISVGQPGFYGRIDIGNYPQPVLVYPQPVVIGRVPVNRSPIYLNVPPGHAKNWRKHCRDYHACGERVYFVQNNWYEREYVPRYQERNSGHRDGPRNDRRDDRGHGRKNGPWKERRDGGRGEPRDRNR